MSESPQPKTSLSDRLSALGRTIGQREATHREGLVRARHCVEDLRGRIEKGLEAFHIAVSNAGAPHLEIALSPVRTDDKHLRSLEFDLVRGRYKAVVTAKSRGDVTLVGPFRIGKAEGPCLTFPFGATDEIEAALATFLEQFLEEAATP